MHRDGLDAELAAGAQDPQRDLAAVGDDDLLEHGRAYSTTNSGWPNSTGSPLLRHDRGDAPCLVGLDLVHHLHGLDDAQHLADLDLVADLDEGLGAGRGRSVERADHRRGDDVLVGLGLRGRAARRPARPARRRAPRRARRAWPAARHVRQQVRHGAAGRHAADAHGFLAFLDLDLGDAGLLQQLDEFLDLANIHAGNAPGKRSRSRAGPQASRCAAARMANS